MPSTNITNGAFSPGRSFVDLKLDAMNELGMAVLGNDGRGAIGHILCRGDDRMLVDYVTDRGDGWYRLHLIPTAE